jgi:hypothetical protein
MQRQDYIERLIQQVAAAIARALGAAEAGRPEEAQHELDAAWSGALGFRRGDVERLDEGTLRMMLGGKLQVAATLLNAEADLRQGRGDAAGADRLRSLAGRL